MSTKTFKVFHKQRYDTLQAWQTVNPVLEQGEIAVSIYKGEEGELLAEPQVYIKVGDGTRNYNDLPFLTAKAGDVYAWAKATTKPTYTADEIDGLTDFIADEIKDTNTLYRIIQGDDAKTFKFQSQERGAEAWTDAFTLHIPEDITYAISSDGDGKVTLTPSEGTATEVTVVAIDQAKEDITSTSTNVPTSGAVADYIADQIDNTVADLDYTDTAVDGEFVTAVSQEDGLIAVVRKVITIDDISDLVFNTAYDKDTNKAATMADVDAASARVFRFKGSVLTVADLPTESNQVGDTYHVKSTKAEYTWAAKTDDEGAEVFEWEKLGNDMDLSAYATKSEVDDALDLKQDLITTDNKLSSALVDGVATTTEDGLMSKEDKAKLDAAQENVIEKIMAGETAVPIDEDKTVTLAAIASTGNVMDLVQDDGDILVLNGGDANRNMTTVPEE